ncbi:ribosomal protection-like ABC-F family protein [Chungangia koreensis]|uniref:Ribosomal protection-like ABC-F family protein n=1 Tax=Chungangia koreensis TaxID=752657 RepID=A0ABV8X507_9LACT
MMTVIGKLQDVTIAYGDKIIIERAKADVPAGAIIGIVGGNGEGKSTLLSLLYEEIEPLSGRVEWFGGNPSVSYFRQDEVEFNKTHISKTESELLRKWSVPTDRDYSNLSGGEKMKQRLSAVLAERTQLLLLDEPTNHLDMDSLEQLKKQLDDYKGTVIMVSHDRFFLDETADWIWELENTKLTAYKGNYTEYRKAKEEARKVQQRLYDAQQSKIQRVERQISELKNWSSKAHADSTKQEGYKEFYRVKAKRMDTQIRSKKKRLELELSKEKVERPEDEKSVHFSIGGNQKKGKRVIEAKRIGKSFGNRTLFQNASFTIQSKERIGLLGPNGSGKSTFFKMLLGQESGEGELWKTEAMNIGYLSQTVLDLPVDQSPESYFQPNDYEQRGVIQTLMTNLGFAKDHWTRPIGTLSMGERVKLKLMEFMLDQKDVLLLDEPTNHLDLPSREQLERTLADYPGTILLVTHDRYFLDQLTDKLLIFNNQTISKIEMGYTDWVNKKTKDESEEDLLRIDTELQAVLGELSFLQNTDPKYEELDRRFLELSKQIREIKQK